MRISKKWVIIVNDCDRMFCLGVFNSKEEAIGKAYLNIGKLSLEYKNDGDKFLASAVEDNGGYFITVEFRASEWDESHEKLYGILPVDEGEDDD